MRIRTYAILAALSTTMFAAACGTDATTAPAAPPRAPVAAPSSSLLGGLVGTSTEVTPLARTTPLASSLTTSAQIGPLGGVLSLPGAGLTVIVPPLAVLRPTSFSVTARAGSAIAYDFAPHGIKFAVPLVVTQNLANTSARNGGLIDPLSLFVGYYPDTQRITTVTELLNVHLDLLNQVAVFDVWHFSGYIFASGRSGGDE